MNKLTVVCLLLTVFTVHAVPYDYLVFQWHADDGLTLYSHQEVDLPLRLDEPQIPPSGSYVLVENDLGKLLQVIDLKLHSVTRSEHHGYNQISDSSFENEVLTFVVRVPKESGHSLQLDMPQKSVSQNYSLKSYLSTSQAKKVKPINKQGEVVDNRINCYCSLSCLTIANNEFTLPSTNRHH